MTTICESTAQAVADIKDGSTVLISGFGMAGMRVELIDALIDQGATDLTLAERMRAAGAGIPAFYCRTGVGTMLTADKETREFDGHTNVLEHALHGDVALIGAHLADRMKVTATYGVTFDELAGMLDIALIDATA